MPQNVFTSCSPIVVGCFLYTDSGLTTPAPDGEYSDGAETFTVSGGAGEITASGICATTTTTTTSTTTASPQSTWTIRNADCGGGTINGVSINGSSIPSLTGNNFPLTSTQSGTVSNPSGINYGSSNTIQANVTTNIAGSGNCAVMYIFINDLFNPAHTLFFTSSPFPQISGVVINGGDVVEVQIACLVGACPTTTTTTTSTTTI